MTVSQGLEGEAGAKLHIVATPDRAGVAVRAQASSESADFGALLSSFSPHPLLTGTGSFNLSLEGRGGNLDALAHTLSGKANLQLRKGVVSLPEVSAEPLASVGTETPTCGVTHAWLAPLFRSEFRGRCRARHLDGERRLDRGRPVTDCRRRHGGCRRSGCRSVLQRRGRGALRPTLDIARRRTLVGAERMAAIPRREIASGLDLDLGGRLGGGDFALR